MNFLCKVLMLGCLASFTSISAKAGENNTSPLLHGLEFEDARPLENHLSSLKRSLGHETFEALSTTLVNNHHNWSIIKEFSNLDELVSFFEGFAALMQTEWNRVITQTRQSICAHNKRAQRKYDGYQQENRGE